MREVVIDTKFENITLDAFAEVYFSEDVNAKAATALKLKERTLVDKIDNDDGTVTRRVKMAPAVDLPKAVHKLIGGAPIEYFEVSTYDPKTHKSKYVVESAADEVLQVQGVISFIADGTGVRRRIDGTVDAKVFGLGGIIEKFIDKEVNKSYAKVAEIIQAEIDARNTK